MLAHARAAMATTCDDSGGSPRHLGYHVQTELMEEKCWQKYSDCEAPDFFEVLDFARDGGFAEVHELWNVMRYVGAVLAIGMMISNLATIVINDSHYLISSAHIERSSSNVTDDDASYVASISEDYMISGMLVDSIFYIVSDVTGLDIQIRSPRIALVGALELILLCLLVMKAFSCIMWSLTTDNQRLRWSMAMTLFWEECRCGLQLLQALQPFGHQDGEDRVACPDSIQTLPSIPAAEAAHVREAFISALNHTDLVITACPAGPDDADAKVLKAEASPSSVSKGDTVQLLCDLNVTKASGVGEYRVAVRGPVKGDVGEGFLLPKGLDVGAQQLGVELKVKDHTSGDEPVVWQPGDYEFDIEVCQGECGTDLRDPESQRLAKDEARGFPTTLPPMPPQPRHTVEESSDSDDGTDSSSENSIEDLRIEIAQKSAARARKGAVEEPADEEDSPAESEDDKKLAPLITATRICSRRELSRCIRRERKKLQIVLAAMIFTVLLFLMSTLWFLETKAQKPEARYRTEDIPQNAWLAAGWGLPPVVREQRARPLKPTEFH
ncbi:unnamed protein product [Cladocopium goreaui]|uniref:Countin-3 n=1 Tax=Cladocopium goreaui TaxID=2562237 RepID=A0A9P1FE82_9DINO|nr:unnamed protein product [Cladocopium goreaui]